MPLAFSVESTPTGLSRVILWEGQIQANGKFKGRILNVMEAFRAWDAIDALIQEHNLRNAPLSVLTEEGTLDYPDETSISEACEAYFGSRNPNLRF